MSKLTLLSPPQAPSPSDPAALPHVLLVLDQVSRTLGGGERIVLKLAALLPQYGFRVSVLTFFAHPSSPFLAAATCPVYELPLTSTYDRNAFHAALELRRFLKAQSVQIVQTFFESSDLWAGLVVKLTSPARLIWSRRDMGILRAPKHHLAYRLLANLPDHVLAVSELVRQYSIDTDGIHPDRVTTIYNGLNLADWTTPTPPPAQPFHITTLGNIRHVKGHDVFLRAASLIVQRHPDTRFTIAGEILEPDYYAHLLELIQQLNLTHHVHFLGGVTNLRNHLTTAHLFVLPSRSEGFSNAIIEAMAASLPVVATNVGGNAEAVQHGHSGLIVPPEDPHALATAILRLLEDPATRSRMGAAGRELVLQKFTIHAMMTHTTQLYQKLLDLPNATP